MGAQARLERAISRLQRPACYLTPLGIILVPGPGFEPG